MCRDVFGYIQKLTPVIPTLAHINWHHRRRLPQKWGKNPQGRSRQMASSRYGRAKIWISVTTLFFVSALTFTFCGGLQKAAKWSIQWRYMCYLVIHLEWFYPHSPLFCDYDYEMNVICLVLHKAPASQSSIVCLCGQLKHGPLLTRPSPPSDGS